VMFEGFGNSFFRAMLPAVETMSNADEGDA
jgi:hypothetical protein